jgi:hypothetical protein
MQDEQMRWQWGIEMPDADFHETRIYELTFAEAEEVVEGYRLAIEQIRSSGHQIGEGILLDRSWKNKAIAEAVSELVGMTPVGESQLGMRAICEPHIVKADL